jgi:hypothetical protein
MVHRDLWEPRVPRVPRETLVFRESKVSRVIVEIKV